MSNDRAIAARRKAGLSCAKKLSDAADSLNDYILACNACDDKSGDHLRGISDSRHILIRDLAEYAGFLFSRYEVK